MHYYDGIKRVPVLRVLLPFITGIILQFNFRVSSLFIACSIIILFVLLCIFLKYKPVSSNFRFRWLYGLALNGFIIFVSMGMMGTRMNKTSFMDLTGREGFIVARVMENPREQEKSLRLLISPSGFVSGSGIIRTSGKAIAWLEKDSAALNLSIGDRIIIPCNFRPIVNSGNPGEFNYRRHMSIQGISGETYVPAGSWFTSKQKEGYTGLRLTAGRLRNHLLGTLASHGLTGREYSVASALILGYRSGLDYETRQIYAGSGAIHILAVSGLHVGILYMLVVWFTGFFSKAGYSVINPVIILLIIWSYALLTGLSPSVTRAAAMFSFFAVSRSQGKPASVINIMASAALVQLVADPFSLFMVGFQLSYLAVAGIIYYQPAVYALLRFNNFLADRIWALLSLSFSAQLLIFPLVMYYFNQFPAWFLITNIFAVPLAMVILYSGLSLFMFSSVPVISSIIAFILNSSLMALNFIVSFISGLPGALVGGISLSLPLVITLYAAVICLSFFIRYKKATLLQFAIIFVTLAFVFRAEYRIRTAGQSVFLVYNARGTSAYNFISGKENFLVSSHDGKPGDRTRHYVASGPAIYLNALKINDFSPDDFFDSIATSMPALIMTGGNFVYFAGSSIYFPGDERSVENHRKPVNTDILVISSRTASDLGEICNRVTPGIVVIDSSVSFHRKSNIIDHCKGREIACHDVSTSGAFVLGRDRSGLQARHNY
jgi:competence protein ComEC